MVLGMKTKDKKVFEIKIFLPENRTLENRTLYNEKLNEFLRIN